MRGWASAAARVAVVLAVLAIVREWRPNSRDSKLSDSIATVVHDDDQRHRSTPPSTWDDTEAREALTSWDLDLAHQRILSEELLASPSASPSSPSPDEGASPDLDAQVSPSPSPVPSHRLVPSLSRALTLSKALTLSSHLPFPARLTTTMIIPAPAIPLRIRIRCSHRRF